MALGCTLQGDALQIKTYTYAAHMRVHTHRPCTQPNQTWDQQKHRSLGLACNQQGVHWVVRHQLHGLEAQILELLLHVEGVVLAVLAPRLRDLESPPAQRRQLEEAAWIHIQDGDHATWCEESAGLSQCGAAGVERQLVQEEVQGHYIEALVRQPGLLCKRVHEAVLRVEELGHRQIVGAKVHARSLHAREGFRHLLRREATAATYVQQSLRPLRGLLVSAHAAGRKPRFGDDLAGCAAEHLLSVLPSQAIVVA
mmetsp:Transcript_47629/g.120061  ORF Transcript_47629/g.120061 Transcript_47629/m.120061 type:complete len:254 (-) Transcript_47629:23-784(-)